ILSLPRNGSRGFKGSFSRTCETPARATAAPSERAAKSESLRGTGGFPGRSGVGRVELGKPGVVAPNVGVVGGELEGLLVLDQGACELAARLEGNGQIVVGAGVVGVLGDGLLETEGGLAPESLPGHPGSERDLGFGALRVGIRAAARSEEKQRDDGPEPALQIRPPDAGRYYMKAFPAGKISTF